MSAWLCGMELFAWLCGMELSAWLCGMELSAWLCGMVLVSSGVLPSVCVYCPEVYMNHFKLTGVHPMSVDCERCKQ